MRDWKRGDLQVFGAAAKFFLFFGLIVAIFAGFDGEWIWVALGGIICVAGLALGIYVIKYQKSTGRSARPFSSE